MRSHFLPFSMSIVNGSSIKNKKPPYSYEGFFLIVSIELLQEQHLLRTLKRAGSYGVKIHSCGNLTPPIVGAVPNNGMETRFHGL